jgi:ABC-2 type transport system permease protein
VIIQIRALFRAAFLTDVSYRVAMMTSLVGLAATTVPVYFISRAVQPVVAESIRTQGGQYFGFVLIGMLVLNFVNSACTAIPGAVSSGIRTGTLEVLLATPTNVPTLLAGMAAYPLTWTLIRGLVLLAAGQMLGAHFAWDGMLPALAVLVLLVLAHLPFGLLGAAMLLVFRTTGPLSQGVVVLSLLLGGVYYPTEVIPAGFGVAANFLPLTYGLRAIRSVFLGSAAPGVIAGDVGILLLFTVGLTLIGWAALAAALRHARRNGALAHY